jgi:hypothetical protein
MNKCPQPSGKRPAKRNFFMAAFSLAMLFAACYLYLIILPSIETKATGFDDYLKNVSQFTYLNDVVIYVLNLVQILLIVMIVFTILHIYDVFGCINIGYPLLLAILSAMAMMSLTFLLRAVFDSSKYSGLGQIDTLFMFYFQLLRPLFGYIWFSYSLFSCLTVFPIQF